MELEAYVKKFIENPFPLWETNLTQKLVQQKWKELQKQGLSEPDTYSTSRSWFNDPTLELDKRTPIIENNGKTIHLEHPCSLLKSFYEEHGLELLAENKIESNLVSKKLRNALNTLKQIQPAYECVTSLVRTIQVLKQNDAEIDLSYSHPQIPFSIFVSVCEDECAISNLRVAESILHEAMHLKLTIIEDIFTLVKANISNSYYSPWKDEERPIRGVLHGLFVFRAIEEFYNEITVNFDNENVKELITIRLKDINSEIASLVEFHKENTLTALGQQLSFKLLRY